jgi:thiamine-phosphate pyrophosphorylase
MNFTFPKVYPILDSSVFPASGRAVFLRQLGISLTGAGVTLIEYRNKTGSDAEILADAEILRASMPFEMVKLILDDRVDLLDRTGFDGVHVDDGDLPPRRARRMLGPDRILGTFGGSEALLPGILKTRADYLAIGPVFESRTKHTEKKPIGIDGVRRLREQAGPEKVLSAAGGITIETAKAVLDAGASMVAVSEAIFRTPDPALTFIEWLRELQ